ncbi:hypothetical protein F442_02546 [Phytophthora nicotianae P10297]|uniref:Uncharacterized protein n=6 Tax=Phytophthora nicotianae TaxID=4792 RepID=W2QPV3_PHYN3|nr:hypothetical protein PPTG_07384 [Phytophthora nicotianae INRA-310]ETI54658.1 hypothetical protein F443_02571 [Phytophthora nicotianae P1569]ETN15222.1 hypothetical protein PPTG_07384 [Phytophthora nicotianae INRA-310]ETP52445.1 hypothetical protein F442_02546 [Phytophthora nicotianae P10297]
MTALLTSDLPASELASMGTVVAAALSQTRASDVATPKVNGSLFEEVTFEDVAVGDEEYEHQGLTLERKTAVSIKGMAVSQIEHRELRSICKALAVPGYKNNKKTVMAHLIALKKLNEDV